MSVIGFNETMRESGYQNDWDIVSALKIIMSLGGKQFGD